MSNFWLRTKFFYKRYSIVAWCFGLFGGGHLLWWEIQQSRFLVKAEGRVRHIGPVKIPYLDELDYFKNKKKLDQQQYQQEENKVNDK
jgi:hypothetical protein